MATRTETGLRLDFRVHLGAASLEIQLDTAAQTVAIFGPSGGGKSTILRVLAGVEGRAVGSVDVMGQRWQDSDSGIFLPPWERAVGWVPQEYLLFPHLTVKENLTFTGQDPDDMEEVCELLMVEGLRDRRPRVLSGGEQQRVALGRALLAKPELLLLDEPFSALDRPLRSHVAAGLRAFVQKRGILLVLVSHDEGDAVALAQEHWLLSEGKLSRVE